MAENKIVPGLMLYFEAIRPALNRLSNEQLGQLVRALVDYAEYGETADFNDPLLGYAFDALTPKIDRDHKRYSKKCADGKYAVYCRDMKRKGKEALDRDSWERSISTDNDSKTTDNDRYLNVKVIPTVTTIPTVKVNNIGVEESTPPRPPDNPKRKRTPFLPPTLEEVTAYCLERGNYVDPEKWFSHYESNGWMVGKNKMKDWKAAVRTWERNDYQKGGKQSDVSGTSGRGQEADRFDFVKYETV